jgi:hypothetical protein
VKNKRKNDGTVHYLPALLKSFFKGILEVVGLEPFGLVSCWLFGSGILLVEDGMLGAAALFFHVTRQLSAAVTNRSPKSTMY